MKNFKLLIVGIFTLVLWETYSFGATLSITPYTGTIGKNCIQEFDVMLMEIPGEEGVYLDIVLDSNMKFIGFKKSDMFEYEIPYSNSGNITRISLFNSRGGEVLDGGNVGKLYYKTVDDKDPYISFVFYSGGAADTSFFDHGVDVIQSVEGGKYILGDNSCEENIEFENQFSGEELDFDEFINEYKNNEINKMSRNGTFNSLFVYSCGCVLLLLFMFLILRKRGKK